MKKGPDSRDTRVTLYVRARVRGCIFKQLNAEAFGLSTDTLKIPPI